MAKLGDEYQALVGAVEQALDPGAVVRVGVWLTGPDGRRDLDVEVRGTANGKPTFVLVECKDWSDPVGIAVVDALDSKRRDLKADKAIVYSNSGFTAPALSKGARLNINLLSALKAGDSRVRLEVNEEFYAKRLSVDRVTVTLAPLPGTASTLPNGWSIGALLFRGLPLQNWLASVTRRLLTDHEPIGTARLVHTFRPSPDWWYEGQAIHAHALQTIAECTRSWLSQTIRKDVTLGLFDHVRQVVTIPSSQVLRIGTFDLDAWQPVPEEPEFRLLAQNSFRLSLTLLNPLRSIEGQGVPDIDSIVIEEQIEQGIGNNAPTHSDQFPDYAAGARALPDEHPADI